MTTEVTVSEVRTTIKEGKVLSEKPIGRAVVLGGNHRQAGFVGGRIDVIAVIHNQAKRIELRRLDTDEIITRVDEFLDTMVHIENDRWLWVRWRVRRDFDLI